MIVHSNNIFNSTRCLGMQQHSLEVVPDYKQQSDTVVKYIAMYLTNVIISYLETYVGSKFSCHFSITTVG
jgi:hypothetical protein